MATYLFRRAAFGIAIVWAVATLSFVLIHVAPGDPIDAMIGDSRVPDAARVQLRHNFGLDQPLTVQYARYVGALARGDLGFSLSQQRPVAAVLADTVPNTLLLMVVSILLAFAGGIWLGAWQGAHADTRVERLVSIVTTVLATLPDFWLATGVLLLFAARLHLFPAAGMVDPVFHPLLSPAGRVLDVAKHLVLPVSVLTVLALSVVARYQRAAMIDVQSQDFLRTARAAGVPSRRTRYRHALRNALLPVVTLFGLALPALFGGALFIESVFALPGMGRTAADAVLLHDYPLVLAVVLASSTLVVVGGVIADVLQAALDPRVRLA